MKFGDPAKDRLKVIKPNRKTLHVFYLFSTFFFNLKYLPYEVCNVYTNNKLHKINIPYNL